MNWLSTIVLLLSAYLAVFLNVYLSSFSHRFGANIDLLPPLLVYIGLSSSLGVLVLVSLAGAFLHDALSANPLGVTVLPLFAAGFLVHWNRDMILRDAPYAQFVLGMMASASVPAATFLLLFLGGYKPIAGFGTLWQWVAMTVIGGAMTPILFRALRRLDLVFNYPAVPEISYRADRQIKRGRHLK
jgi:hypothetical protein